MGLLEMMPLQYMPANIYLERFDIIISSYLLAATKILKTVPS